MINSRSSQFGLFFLAAVLDFVSLFLVLNLWYPRGLSADMLRLHWWWFAGLFVVWGIIRYIFDLFDGRSFKFAYKGLRRLFKAWAVSLIAGALYFYFQPQLLLTPRRFLLSVVTLSFSLFGLLAPLTVFFKGKWQKNLVYSLGVSESETALLRDVLNSGQEEFCGALNNDSFPLSYNASVILGDGYVMQRQDEALLLAGRRSGARFFRLSDWVEGQERKVLLSRPDSLWILEFGGGRRVAYDRIKRLLDIFVGLLFLPFAAMGFLVFGIFIKLSSSGPVIFKQKRVGQNGRDFIIYKFRTMKVNPGVTWTEKQDSRITGFGKLLRFLRLDELPQAWNIFKGEMSLVGPRPEQVGIVEQVRKVIPFYDERHALKPGLTGWAQLHVYAASIEESKLKLEYDLYYVKHRSFWFDLEIIARTLVYILFGSKQV